MEVTDFTQLSDKELIAVPEKSRDGNLSTAAMMEMLRRLKEAVDTVVTELRRNR